MPPQDDTSSSSFLNESLGLVNKPLAKKKAKYAGGNAFVLDRHRHVSRLDIPDRATKRRPLVAEKSYDHEVKKIIVC